MHTQACLAPDARWPCSCRVVIRSTRHQRIVVGGIAKMQLPDTATRAILLPLIQTGVVVQAQAGGLTW